MALSTIRKQYVRRALLDFSCSVIGLSLTWTLFRVIGALVGIGNELVLMISLNVMAFLMVCMLIFAICRLISKIALACKPWDMFPVRILNKVTDSQGNLRVTLDSPLFAYYISSDKEEQARLEAEDQVTIIAYGTKFIALY